MLLVKNIAKIVGVDESGRLRVKGRDMNVLGEIDNAWLLADGDRIAAYGTMDKMPEVAPDDFRVGSNLRHLVHRAVCGDTVAVGQQPGVVDLAEHIHVAALDPKTASLVHTDDLGYVLNE